MAVFLLNTCKFNSCGMTFSTLGDLIQHIEDTHLESDPRILEKQELQQPPSLPLSYVLRLFCDAGRKDVDLIRKRPRASSPATSSIRSITPTGSEFDEDDVGSDDEDSDDSWTTQEEFSSEVILSMMANTKDVVGEKPFACPVPGCNKRYKNVNGIKYHARHGHRKDARFVVKKAFKCKCGKNYKTAQSLRNHQILHHPVGALIKTSPSAQAVIATATLNTSAVPHQIAALPQNATIAISSLPAVSLPISLPQTLVSTMAAPITVTMTTDNHNISNIAKQLQPTTISQAVPTVTLSTVQQVNASQPQSISNGSANHVQAHVQAAHALAHAHAQAKQVAQALQNATNNSTTATTTTSNISSQVNATSTPITNLVQSVGSVVPVIIEQSNVE